MGPIRDRHDLKPLIEIENQQHTNNITRRVMLCRSENVEQGPGENSSAREGTIRFHANSTGLAIRCKNEIILVPDAHQ
jgi:hypothetical protein